MRGITPLEVRHSQRGPLARFPAGEYSLSIAAPLQREALAEVLQTWYLGLAQLRHEESVFSFLGR
jgi:hypothetical protein